MQADRGFPGSDDAVMEKVPPTTSDELTEDFAGAPQGNVSLEQE